jgi:hypothetical protein
LAQMVSATVVFCTVETEGVAFAALSAVDPRGGGLGVRGGASAPPLTLLGVTTAAIWNRGSHSERQHGRAPVPGPLRADPPNRAS